MAKNWTLAQIEEGHAKAGGHFFSQGAMDAFGDTRESFTVVQLPGRIFVQRVKPRYFGVDGPELQMDAAGIGFAWEFFPKSGRIVPVVLPMLLNLEEA